MNLQGRDLSEGVRGEDVALLHTELTQLRDGGLLVAEIAPDEVGRRFFGPTTKQAVAAFQGQQGLAATGEVDEATARRINEAVDGLSGDTDRYAVRGRVHRNGRPYTGGLVRAFDRDMRSEELLGEATTDEDGRYEITYTADRFARAEKERADLLVRVYDASGSEAAASGILFNAAPIETVDLDIVTDDRVPSEYERYLAELIPLVQGVPLAELTDEDRTFLHGETGIDARHLVLFTLAAQHGEQTDLPPELYYGLFREGLPTSLARLFTMGPGAHRRSLETALRRRIVPARLGSELEEWLDRLEDALTEHAIRPADDSPEASFSTLFRMASVAPEVQRMVMRRLVDGDSDEEDFWEGLRGEVEPAEIERLRFTFGLATLTQYKRPLLDRLMAMQSDGRLTSLRDLVGTDWEALLRDLATDGRLPIPDHILGTSEEDRLERYVAGLTGPLEAAFPEAYLRRELANSPAVNARVLTVLERASNLDLRTTDLRTWVEAGGSTVLEEVAGEEREAVVRNLQVVQRLARITPQASQVRALLELGLTSALHVTRYSPGQFVERFRDRLGGEEAATQVYRAAQHRSAQTAVLFGGLQETADSLPYAIGGSPQVQRAARKELTTKLATLETLFERLSFCECRHCRSVYSPAAYFVDLLHGLDDPTRSPSPLTVLLRRRPDLAHLRLSCENTNTLIPYIDLINEVLESYVVSRFNAGDDPPQIDAFDVGELTSEVLRALPQHINPDAYDVLRTAYFPMTLPFHEPLATVRAYLQELGTSRAELMESAAHAGMDIGADYPEGFSAPEAVAAERLGLAPEEAALITGQPLEGLSPQPWQVYGYDEEQPGGTSWMEDVLRVPVFLQRTGLSYDELNDLVGTRFANPNLPSPERTSTLGTQVEDWLTLHSPTTACDLDAMRLQPPNTAEGLSFLSHAHRLIRLWRAVGGSFRDLDRVLTALDANSLDTAALHRIAVAHQVTERLKRIPMIHLLALWEALDTWGDDALYFGVFQSPDVARTNGADVFRLDADRVEIADTSHRLHDHLSSIRAGLGIPAGSLNTLLHALQTDISVTGLPDREDGLPDGEPLLTRKNLSGLYRRVLLARALRMPIADLVSLIELIGVDPFAAHDPSGTLAFVTEVASIQTSGFSVGQLTYLYHDDSEAHERFGPAEQEVSALLSNLQKRFAAVAEETRVPESVERTAVRTALEQIPALEKDIPELVLTLIDPAEDGFPHLDEADAPTPERERVAEALRPYLHAPDETFNALFAPHDEEVIDTETRTGENLLTLLAAHHTWQRLRLQQMATIQVLADALLLEEQIVTRLLTAPASETTALLDVFLALAEPQQTPEMLATARSSMKAAFERLHRATMLITQFDLRPPAIEYVWDEQGAYEPADLIGYADTAETLAQGFVRWQRLRDLAALAGQLPGDGTVQEEQQWRQYDALAERLGVSLDTLKAWGATVPGPEQRAAVQEAVKAHYGDGWLQVLPPLSDRLREVRRLALVDFLLPRLTAEDGAALTGTSRLYALFLIDPEMSACMQTSRIKQAISSVQLFVQRCLLNLEAPEVPTEAIDAEAWKWRKNYRVWEANRRVFLYPENYILFEPQFRQDRTPFIEELDAELQQNDLTDGYVEQAVQHYLEKLHEVARLDICAMYRELGNGVDTLHLFGRTHAEPRRYFYRRWIRQREWTPWEPVPLDIEGDHLIPVVANRRLYLFWATFTEKPAGKQPAQGEPEMCWEIKLHWSERQSAGWSPKLSSSGTIRSYPWEGWVMGTKTADVSYPAWLPLPDLKQETYDAQPHSQKFGVKFDAWKAKRLDEWLGEYAGWYAGFLEADVGFPHDPPEPPEVSAARSELAAKYLLSEFDNLFEQIEEEWLPTYVVWFVSYFGWWVQQPRTVEEQIQKRQALGRPTPDRHTFRTQVGEQDLTLGCYARVRTADGYDTVQWVGSFTLDDCTNELTANSVEGPVALYLPERLVDLSELQDAHDVHQMKLRGVLKMSQQKMQRLPSGNEKKSIPKPIDAAVAFEPDIRVLDWVHRRRMILPLHQHTSLEFPAPFVYSDATHTYLAHPLPPPISGASRATLKLLERPHRTSLAGPQRAVQAAYQQPLRVTDQAVGRGLAYRGFVQNPALNFGSSAQTSLVVHNALAAGRLVLKQQLRFVLLQHPYTCEFISALRRGGLPSLLTMDNQRLARDTRTRAGTTLYFTERFKPTGRVAHPRPRYDVDFESEGSYAVYNWEVFFHIPMLLATRHQQEGQFAKARHYLEYVLSSSADVSADGGPGQFWRVRPFRDHTEYDRIGDLLALLGQGAATPAVERLKQQIAVWQENPFEPHRIAQLRPLAYQKAVFFKLIDIIVDEADVLNRRDTIESINEATQLYLLAADMLGPRPHLMPPRAEPPPLTYSELPTLDEFSNAWIAVETSLPVSEADATPLANRAGEAAALQGLGVLYFCIPHNAEMLKYWDTVADRLYKIRHCQNIEGVERALSLFEPPIDPMLLVRARAAGLDIDDVLGDLYAPLPPYRFTYLLQKALEFTGEVKALGSGLLSALEKRDGESLARLRAVHETSLLKAALQVKQQAVLEARENEAALREGREVVNQRHQFYSNIERRSRLEKQYLDQLDTAQDWHMRSRGVAIAASALSTFGDLSPGTTPGGTTGAPHPTIAYTFGSTHLMAGARAISESFGAVAAHYEDRATLSRIRGEWERRANEWDLQRRLAAQELIQYDRQIAAAEIRIAMAEQDLANHEQQIEQTRSVEEFLRNKYTNVELYGWEIGERSRLYYQTYKLAYDMARRAQRAFHFWRGTHAESFIQFGYWDNLRKGLLSGEKLYLDLKRMEMAYLNQNRREYEITKQISLVLHDPMALITLKETGQCIVELREALFDMDYPGHYMRRIKSVSVTIPCIIGPYTSINCTLTLLKNKIRIDSNAQQDYAEQEEDGRFITDLAAIQSIATSHARNDPGMFELNFQDERYLPFEGAGVDSRWRIDMSKACNAFDFDTISDVILTINYTAHEGGALLRKRAMEAALLPAPPQQPVAGATTPELPKQQHLQRLFSARHEFATEWHRFLHPHPTASKHTLTLDLTSERFPFRFRAWMERVSRVDLFVEPAADVAAAGFQGLAVSLFPPDSDVGVADNVTSVPSFLGGMPHAVFDVESDLKGYGTWIVEIGSDAIATLDAGLRTIVDVDGTPIHRLNPSAIQDLHLVCHYVA